MKANKPLSGRLALVTGSSRGIGAATAKALAAAGAHVVLTGRDVKALETVEDAIHADGGPRPSPRSTWPSRTASRALPRRYASAGTRSISS